MTLRAYRAEILHVTDDPAVGAEAVAHYEDGLILVEGGVIVRTGAYADLIPHLPKDTPVTAFPGGLITPGFVDLHTHYPQTDIIAAHGAQLLDWLERHTFPAEAAFGDATLARETAEFFLSELLRNGTTTALVFGSVHPASVDALFEAALERKMRLIGGKVLMDRNAPPALRDTVDEGRLQTEALIAKWRGRGRLGYAVTPRFAITSTEAQLRMAGEVLAAHGDVYLHTHLAENVGEVAETKALFPDARDYLDVYDRFGLVGDRSVFAHCVHMPDDGFGRLKRAGSAIAVCPTSNLFLGSGLFDLQGALAQGGKLGLGTDIGAGTSFSLLATMAEAYKVGQLKGYALDPFQAFYRATLGGARALNLGDRIGDLSAGSEADFLVIDPGATPLMRRRMARATTLKERLFALMMLGDDRAIAHTYVAGRLAHSRDAGIAHTSA